MPSAPKPARRALAPLALASLAAACTGRAPPDPLPAAPAGAPAPPAEASRPPPAAPRGDARRPAPGAFALVELFTSEGCSSCPPADQALDDLADDAERQGLRVYPLSFHVDYWNALGWVDPFSTSAYTHRQQAYASRAGARGLYTPQMVVNGGEGFNGSDRTRARHDVELALGPSAPSPTLLSVRVDASRPSIRVELDATGLASGAFLNVALAERTRAQRVARGENAGRTLRHRNVVRAFETLRPRGPGPWTVELPAAGLDRGALVVVAYAQDPATLAVLGAEAAPVAAPTAR